MTLLIRFISLGISKYAFQRNTVYNIHSLLISKIGFQSDSLQKTEISLGKLVLICRMMDGVTPMLLCFNLISETRCIQKQDSFKRCVLIPLIQAAWDIKGFYENQAMASLFLRWLKSSHSDVLEFSALLKTAQSFLIVFHKEGHGRRLISGSVLTVAPVWIVCTCWIFQFVRTWGYT